MTSRTPALDEAILAVLGDGGVRGSAQLATALGAGERTIRRRLRRLIGDGYVFSPFRGGYRITAAGVAAIAPLPPVRSPR